MGESCGDWAIFWAMWDVMLLGAEDGENMGIGGIGKIGWVCE